MAVIEAALDQLEEKSSTVMGMVAELRAVQAAQKAESAAGSPPESPGSVSESSGTSSDSDGASTPELDPSLAPL